MRTADPTAEKASSRPRPGKKGERTANRILDAAERLFAERGFEAASLREIATAAGIQEPGLYNYFGSKKALYAAVLDRAMAPMAEAMEQHLTDAGPREAHSGLPSLMTDILLEHPKLAAFFQQALQGDRQSVGNQLIKSWLDRLFGQAIQTLDAIGGDDFDRPEMAIHIIAMFNLTTGYFLSQRALESMVEGNITDPANIERQKRLLERLMRATLGG